MALFAVVPAACRLKSEINTSTKNLKSAAKALLPHPANQARATRRRSYRFFSVALAVLRRAACAAGAGFDTLACSADCAAAALVRRTARSSRHQPA
jgi:hypothetical protein